MTEDKPTRAPFRISGGARVWILNIVLLSTAGILFGGPLRGEPAYDRSVVIPWLFLAAIFYVTERFVVHVQFRRDSESFSLSEIPLVVALFFVSPLHLVTAQLAGAGAALLLHRRQSPMKLAFNLCQFAFGTGVASVVFRAVAGGDGSLSAGEAAAAFLAVCAATVIGVGMVVVAISLSEGEAHLRMIPRVVTMGAIVALTNASVALVAILLLRIEPWTVWLLVVPAVTLYAAYRAYQQQRVQNESLEFLYESTRMLQGSLEIENTMRSLLDQARKMFRAEIARVTFFPSEEEDTARRTILGPDQEWVFMRHVQLDPKEGVWARVAAEGQAVVVPKPIRNERLRVYFESQGGIRDAMVAPVFGAGNVIGTLLVANRLGDVTTFDQEDLKLFETFTNHASVSLENARLVARLRGSLAKMTEMNRLKDDFVATVSHELRTPLTSILGNLKTLLRADVRYSPEDTRGMLEAAERQSERLRALIEDLLLVSRVESQPIRTARAPVSVTALAQEVVEDLRKRDTGHRLEVESDPQLPAIRTDESAVRRIVSNLVDNALKYSPAGTVVHVKVRRERDEILLTVEDEGPGVPAEARERVFERFFQLDQSNTRTVGGAGLGLYICRSLANSIGGTMSAGESPSGGAAFTLRLPIGAETVEPDETLPPPTPLRPRKAM